jgi:hypothetical protein
MHPGAPVTPLLDADADVARVLERLVHELVEREEGADDLLVAMCGRAPRSSRTKSRRCWPSGKRR